MRVRLVVVSLVVIVLGAACGSNSNDAASSPSAPTATTPPTTPPVATSPPAPTTPANCDDQTGQAVFELVMQNTAFSPHCAIAKSSQSIKIENKDGILHNFSITGTSVDVDVQPGQTFTGPSAGLAPGTYPFFCKYHKALGMTGTVIVQ
jgi:plastocyanin